jgi:hypothetical protein
VNGVPTDEAVIARFRAHYLYSGNASKSARECGLPMSTGRDLAQRISLESDFVEARRKLRAQALDELVAMRQRVCEVAADRFEEELPVPENVGEGANVTIIDKRADYAKVVLDGEKNAHNLARFDAERGGEIAPQREVVLKFEPIATKAPGG